MIGAEPNLNALWAGLLIEELVRQGVSNFIVSPGSRSTPLTVAAATNPRAACVVHFDERGAAFHALGLARATGRPAACICTSGTAVANYLPAVVEAAQSFVPLIMITADRPPELLDTGANQAILQAGLFRSYARWEATLPCPTEAIDPGFVLTTAAHAAERARMPAPGPVHLNCQFREPLAPTGAGGPWDEYLRPVHTWRTQQPGHPFTAHAHTKTALASDDAQRLALRLRGIERGIIVAGQLDDPMEVAAVERLAKAWGWPLLPDITSGLRLRTQVRAALPHYDALLLSARFQGRLAPQAVVQVGGPIVSKRLQQFLTEFAPPVFVRVADHPMRVDPGHRHTMRIQADVARFCEWASGAVPATVDTPWLQRLLGAQGRIHTTLEVYEATAAALDEVYLARIVARRIPAGHALFLGNSMPIRDMDSYAGTDGNAARVFANRGASGIDGNLATIAGIARGLGQAVTGIVGDLAVLHDLNSLALLRELDTPVTLVVPNNDGGGIFHFLPIAEQEAVFERYFATPHGMTLEHAAAQFGIAYHRAGAPPALTEAYSSATVERRHTLIDVPIDRSANTAAHRALQRALVEAIEESL